MSEHSPDSYPKVFVPKVIQTINYRSLGRRPIEEVARLEAERIYNVELVPLIQQLTQSYNFTPTKYNLIATIQGLKLPDGTAIELDIEKSLSMRILHILQDLVAENYDCECEIISGYQDSEVKISVCEYLN